MPNTPKISIIVPVYNVEKYIRRCLISLLKNSIINDCEIVIVNDFSSDNSLSVIKDVLNEFDNPQNVTVHSHDCNRGSSAARNTAMLCTPPQLGKYIVCVDSDDWVESDYLEKLYKIAEETDSDIVGCDYYREYKDYSEKCENPLNKNSKVALKDIVSGKTFAFLWIKLFKRELFTKNNITWTEGVDVTEDVIICSRLFSKAKKISYINEPLYHYNLQNQESLTASLNEKKITQIITACDLLEKELANDSEYFDAVKQRKAFSKIWILRCADKLKDEYFLLWNEEKLYKVAGISLKRRIILFLCNCGFVKTVKKILKFCK